MLAKCSNPSCGVPFRYLNGGRLFRLESDSSVVKAKRRRPEYFWLCAHCSRTMTLRLDPSAAVVAVLLPDKIRGISNGVALILSDRQQELWLHTISSLLSAPVRHRARVPALRAT